ncbi:unnamed protein product [Withania somnifera]
MEVNSFSCEGGVLEVIVLSSVLEAVVAETLLVAQRSVACLLMLTGCLLKDGAPLPELVSIAPLSDLASRDRRFPFEALINQKTEACPENVDGSDTENDDEDDDGDAEDQDDDDDANDEDFSGEEGGDDDDCEGDPEEDPTANGNEGSDDDANNDDDDDDGGGDEEGDDDDDEEDEDQRPAKKRK